MRPGPTLRVERALLVGRVQSLAAMDEVGRGALAGPVSVGVVLIGGSVEDPPDGVRDSKLLAAAAREALVPQIRRWARAHAVGHAGATEVDEVGIIGALRLAGGRALAALGAEPDVILLDGSHDWLSDPMNQGLFAAPAPPVVTRVKADLECAGVAAASVLAKVERDEMMAALHRGYPHYGWSANKGYASAEHLGALAELGPCAEHRRSWQLPGVPHPPDHKIGRKNEFRGP
ncbi:MAG: ribonuclease HII [Angustibacter sp.]